jgi:pyruvate/2-oxoglutarate/acetoin dehydrogenase E1 component
VREITYRQAINEALYEEMARDETVFILGESICHEQWDTHAGLVDAFGLERVRETAISETAIVGAAVGAALAGYRPIADIMFSDFLYCATDEVLNQAATHRFSNGGKTMVPLVIKTAIGGYGSGGPMHSQCPEAFLWHRPGLKIALPATPYDAKGLLKASIRDNNPVVFLFHKLLLDTSGEVPLGEYVVPLGVAEVRRQGTDVSVIAISYMVSMALAVAEELEQQGVSVEVVDVRSLEPLDTATILDSVRKTGRAVVVDEDLGRCGAAAEIAMQIMERAFADLRSPVRRVTAANLPVPAGCLEREVLPKPQDIADAIAEVMGLPGKLAVGIGLPGAGFSVG